MKKSHAVFLYILTTALAIACVVILVIWPLESHACERGHWRYVSTQSQKPVIEFTQLTDAQKSQLKDFGAQVTAMVETTRKQFHAESTNLDEKERFERLAVVHDQIRRELLQLGERLSFRTKMVVGNGMLCGARIEILVPPPAEDIVKVSGAGVYIDIRGKGRDGSATEGSFGDALRKLSELR